MTYVMAHFHDAPPGPPTSWVPPGVPHSPNPLSSDDEPPTSLWREEGQAGILAGDAGDSLNRGEGQAVGCRFMA